MIIITNNDGQLCNQLLLFANVNATGIETKQGVAHLAGRDIPEAAALDPDILRKLSIRIFPWSLRSPLQGIAWTLTDVIQALQGTRPPRTGRKTVEESRAYLAKSFPPPKQAQLFRA